MKLAVAGNLKKAIMRTYLVFLYILFCISGIKAKETSYTGSTPAAPLVRQFLGISLNDSIDFIRWKLDLRDNNYSLHCNYGIGKANTNGFINGGKMIDLSGSVKRKQLCLILQNNNHILNLAILNSNLVHILNQDKSLLIGNGGWSYTLNNMAPVTTDQMNFKTGRTILADSMAFQGRTPCGVPGIIPESKECYKQKWLIIFYTDAGKNQPATYNMQTTNWRKEGGKKGTWKIITGKDGRIIYQLNDENEKPLIYLLKLDEGILIFTDKKGNLLVGDLDFSYTLGRKF